MPIGRDKAKLSEKILGEIVGKGSRPSDDETAEEPETEGEPDRGVGLEAAAGDAIDAFESGDRKALASALKSFVTQCMSEDYE
jgi:hypothetical protein